MVEWIVGILHGVCNMPRSRSPIIVDVLLQLASTSFFFMNQRLRWGNGQKLMTGDSLAPHGKL